MDWQIVLYLVPYLLSAAISAGVGLYAWRRRTVAGAFPFALMALAQASWTVGYLFELASPSLEAKIFWDNTQFVAAFLAPLAFLACALEYTGRKLSHPARTFGLLAAPIAIFLLLVFTDGWHGLVRPTAWLVPGEPFPALMYDFTVSVIAVTLYGYGLVLAGVLLLVAYLFRSPRLYRAQIATILLGVLIPLLGIALTLAGVTLTFQRDMTPFTFALGNLLIAWALFRYRLFDVAPVARDQIIESMSDAVIVLDAQNRVVDLNPAAREIIGQAGAKVIGRQATQAFAAWPDLVTRYEAVKEAHTELVMGQGEGQRHLDLNISPLRDWHGRLLGRVIVWRDITARKRAEEALRRRVEELAVLNRIAQTVTTVTHLPAALESVVEMVADLFDARAIAITAPAAKGAELRIRVLWERSLVSGTTPPILPLTEMPAIRQVLAQGQTLVLPDVQTLRLAAPLREYVSDLDLHAVMLVPLRTWGAAIGVLSVSTDQAGRTFTPAEVALAETIASNVAAAIENAHLYQQAQETAAAEERNRLARDLHDAVTQTIYAASLIVEALPQVWARDPAEGRRNLAKLRQLVRGALAEMRTLLFELRPTALAKADLGALLHQLADALTGRTRIPVDLAIEGEARLPPEVAIALYRIAQEAFNNVAKHAGATHVAVTLQRQPEQVRLAIRDDGRGFDPGAMPADRLGMSIMRERAQGIGARLEVESAPGKGARVSVVWPDPEGEQQNECKSDSGDDRGRPSDGPGRPEGVPVHLR